MLHVWIHVTGLMVLMVVNIIMQMQRNVMFMDSKLLITRDQQMKIVVCVRTVIHVKINLAFQVVLCGMGTVITSVIITL